MHESIAKATYKGYVRKLQSPLNVPHFRYKTKRAAWLRQLIKAEAQYASSVLLMPPHITGEKKHAKLKMLGVNYIHDSKEWNTNPFWVGYSIHADAKTFDFDYRLMPVLITNHMVQRTMQRLDIADPPTALRSLRTAILSALVLGPPDGREALLPTKGGAVIAAQDKEDPRFWALITFIDENRLRPEQIREANCWGEQAAGIWRGMKTPQAA